MLNTNNLNSKNLNNVIYLNLLGLNHKNEDFDSYRVITKENIQEILSNLLDKNEMIIVKNI